jgi:hypothetical protein
VLNGSKKYVVKDVNIVFTNMIIGDLINIVKNVIDKGKRMTIYTTIKT